MKTYAVTLRFKVKAESRKDIVYDIMEFTKMLPYMANKVEPSLVTIIKEEKGE